MLDCWSSKCAPFIMELLKAELLGPDSVDQDKISFLDMASLILFQR
jgi:hypothetical protein